MKKTFSLLLLAFAFCAFGQGQFQKEVVNSINFSSQKVMQLAKEVPAASYDWSPGEGVRSFRDVFAHVVSANYFFGSKIGAKLPENINLQTLEKDLKTKEQITAALEKSYQFITMAIKNASDEELAKKVEFPFPGEFTSMSAIIIALTHTNEHLGQLIAYSRMNNIAPPWSEKEND